MRGIRKWKVTMGMPTRNRGNRKLLFSTTEKYLFLPTPYELSTEKQVSKFGKTILSKENRIANDMEESLENSSCMQFIKNDFLPQPQYWRDPVGRSGGRSVDSGKYRKLSGGSWKDRRCWLDLL